ESRNIWERFITTCVLMTATVSFGGISMRFSRRTFSLAAAIAPFIVPAAGHSQATASSSHDFEPASDRLTGMLEYVPQTAVLADLFGFIWLDIERHLASVRERIDAASEEFIEDEAAYMSLYAAG